MDDGFITIDGIGLEVRRLGEGALNQPVLVFLHEGLGSIALWRDFPDRLAACTGLPAFVYSRHGFGNSDARSQDVPFDYHTVEAEQVLPKLLTAVGVQRPILIGHSDGGTIALLYAASDVSPEPVAVITMAAHVFNENITIRGIEDAVRSFKTGGLRDRLRRYHPENVDAVFYGWSDTWLHPWFREWNIEAALPRVRCPVLVIQGADDPYGSPRQVTAIADGVSGPAEMLLIPACGHAPHLERPAIVDEVIADFVSTFWDQSERDA